MTRQFWWGFAAGSGTPPVAYAFYLLMRWLLRVPDDTLRGAAVHQLFETRKDK